MKPFYKDHQLTVHNGDALETLKVLPSESVQCCVTSPPYFNLRDYGVAGQIGAEATPEQFIAKLVDVFREVRRVLKDDGVIWINIGDSYAGSGRGNNPNGKQGTNKGTAFDPSNSGYVPDGCKPKDLLGIPWMLAFALRADGWYLRSEIIWHKPNPMPESVTDRPTKSHEQIFLLSKSASYFYDSDAIKEQATYAGDDRKGRAEKAHKSAPTAMVNGIRPRSARDSFKRDDSKRAFVIPGQTVGTHRPDREESEYDLSTRNKRSVWSVATKPYAAAHFATFPPALIEPCILAGSRPGDTVLDPFGGSGTTAEVANKFGRKAELIELNSEYCELIIKRNKQKTLW